MKGKRASARGSREGEAPLARSAHRKEVDRWIADRLRRGDVPGVAGLDPAAGALPVVPAEAYYYRRHVFFSDALRAYQETAGPLVRDVQPTISREPPPKAHSARWKRILPAFKRLEYRVLEWPVVDGDMRPARRKAVAAILAALGEGGLGGREGDGRAAEKALVTWCESRLVSQEDLTSSFMSHDPETRVAAEVRLHVHRLLLLYRDPADFFERKAPALYPEWRASGPDWLLSLLSTWGSAALLSEAIRRWFLTESRDRQLVALALLDHRSPGLAGELEALAGTPSPPSGVVSGSPDAGAEIEERKRLALRVGVGSEAVVAALVRSAAAASKGPRRKRTR